MKTKYREREREREPIQFKTIILITNNVLIEHFIQASHNMLTQVPTQVLNAHL